MRSVPMFPIKSLVNCNTVIILECTFSTGRPKSAEIKATVCSHAVQHIPGLHIHYHTVHHVILSGGGIKKVPVYRTPDYKNTIQSKVASQSEIHPSEYCSRLKIQMKCNDIARFKKVKAKVDVEDPAPWLHTSSHNIEDLIEADGFAVNARFNVKSNSFGTIEELLHMKI